MKYNKLFFLLCFIGAGLSYACQSEQNAVEKAAYGYLDAMGNYRIKDAEKYASPTTVENTLHNIEQYIMPKIDTTYVASNTPATIEITGVTITTDSTATVQYTKTTPIQVQNGELELVKIGGKWLAEVSIQIPAVFKETQDIQLDSSNMHKFDNVKLVPAKKRPKLN